MMPHRSIAQTIHESRDAFIRSALEAGVSPAFIRQYKAHQRYIMGLVANVIAAVRSVDADKDATISTLQCQLATAQANALDPSDLAAIQSAENDPAVAAKLAALSNGSSGSVASEPTPNVSSGSPVVEADPNASSGSTAPA